MRLLVPISLLVVGIAGFLAFVGLFISPVNWLGQLIGFIIAAVILAGAGFMILRRMKGKTSEPKDPDESDKPTPPTELYEE